MNKKNETKKGNRFEFIFYINNNIICQRDFNFENFNEKVINSLELRELMGNIIGINNDNIGTPGIIPKFLKNKSVNMLWEHYNPYVQQKQEDIKITQDKIDNFQFVIKIDKRIIASGEFPGSYFQPKVRYGDWVEKKERTELNIREIIPDIINEIKYFFTLENYTVVA